MFKFHINGFVINLVTTSGGIESMGASAFDNILLGALALFCVFLATGALYFSNWTFRKLHIQRKREIICYSFSALAGIIFALFICVEFAYMFYKNDSSLITNSQKIALYQPTRMNHFLQNIGIKRVARTKQLQIPQDKKSLNYPLKETEFKMPKKTYNIVWLVAESWRWDTLNKEIMPATMRFSRKTIKFNNHYSAGNGTRMALFGMFYGIYGSYFNTALAEKSTPVIMDVLKKENYQFGLYTSAKFSYPEFDKTIFSNIDSKYLHQKNGRGGFKFDRENVTDMLNFVKARDKSRPFMTFMFFESPHAPYTFPEECAVKKDYLPTFHYSTVDIEKNISKIKNRYLNSVNHLDTQLDRIYKFLEKESLMENTIVVVAGDHGEEFLEKGHWGHNESFHEEQVRTPLLLWIPGKKHKENNFLSSHLDLPATIAPFIGIKNPPEDYSLGYNLLGTEHRSFSAISSWSRICYVDKKFKYDTSTVANILLPDRVSLLNDSLPTKKQQKELSISKLMKFMKNTVKFLK